MESSFCWSCGGSLSPDDVYCANCGQMVQGKRALNGNVSLNPTQEQWIFIGVGALVLAYVVNIILSFAFPSPTGPFDWTWMTFLLPLLAAIFMFAVLGYQRYKADGLQKWIGKKLNPYKPMRSGDRIGALVGSFLVIIPLFFLFYIFVDESIPLLARRDVMVAIVLFVPLILDSAISLAKFAGGNAPEMRPVLAFKDLISIVLLSYLVSNWFFDIPGTITWLGEIPDVSIAVDSILASTAITPELIDMIIQVIIRFSIAILILTFFWHLFMFTVWLDVKYSVLGGNIASVIPQEETKPV